MKTAFNRISAAALVIAGIASGGTQAATACKTLVEEGQCRVDSECRWINGYQRKDGIAVKAHCRARPGAGKGAAMSQPPSDGGRGANAR